MIVINLFGSPGAGKSTTAAGLFYLMKSKNINCELVNEFAKQLVWQERHQTLSDQLYIFAKQNHRLFQLNGKVDFVITDSPILNSNIYNELYNTHFNKLVVAVFDSYDNINFLINRTKPYNPIGRLQNEKEADDLTLIIKNELLPYPYIELDGDSKAPEKIYQEISNRI